MDWICLPSIFLPKADLQQIEENDLNQNDYGAGVIFNHFVN
jgi:hypothetical protein